jgi:hypothetical protein
MQADPDRLQHRCRPRLPRPAGGLGGHRASVGLDIRILPGQTPDDFAEHAPAIATTWERPRSG